MSSYLLNLSARRRMPPVPMSNPMDKSTVFSLYPRTVITRNHTLNPGYWIIEPGTMTKPTSLIIGPSYWIKDFDPDQRMIAIPTGSMQIAESIVVDYINGMVGCDMGEKRPGLFWLPGEVGIMDLISSAGRYYNVFTQAVNRQKNWYQELIKMGDIHWARTNGNPLAISDDMRLAAKELGVEHLKDWTKENQFYDMVRCTACGSLRNPQFPICATCKTDHGKAPEPKAS